VPRSKRANSEVYTAQKGNKMNRCIFVESIGFGAKVFYFRYSEYDKETVFIYSDEDLKNLVMGCDISQIIILDNSATMKYEYLDPYSFNQVYKQWKGK
jgi:hypothetical protein